MSESKLKRCPFAKCGGQGKSQSNMYYGFWIHCSKCKAMTDYYEDPEEAAVAWNDRTPEPWLPIETAPKDGTEVLLQVFDCNGDPFIEIGHWGLLAYLTQHFWLDRHRCPIEIPGEDEAKQWKPLPEINA